MDIILKERNCQEKIPPIKAFAYILGIILFINLTVVLLNRLNPLVAGAASIILIIAVMFIAYRVMTGKATEYYYILTNNGLLFHRAMGIREIVLMEIPFDNIISLKPIEDFTGQVKLHYFLCNKKDARRMLLVFKDKGKRAGVVFSPGSKMAKAIIERTGEL